MVSTNIDPSRLFRLNKPDSVITIPRRPGVPFEEGIIYANSVGYVVPNLRQLAAIIRQHPDLKTAVPCFSGVVCAYRSPDKELGPIVETIHGNVRWVLEVPPNYQELSNVLLAVRHPNFELDIQGSTRIVIPKNASDLVVVKLFYTNLGDELPLDYDRLEQNSSFGIPPTEPESAFTYSLVSPRQVPYVGPVVFSSLYPFTVGNENSATTRLTLLVDINTEPTYRRGMILLAPDHLLVQE